MVMHANCSTPGLYRTVSATFVTPSASAPSQHVKLAEVNASTKLVQVMPTGCSMVCFSQAFGNKLHITSEISASSEEMILLCPAARTSDAYKVFKVMPMFLFFPPSSCYSVWNLHSVLESRLLAWPPFHYKRDGKFLKSPWPPPTQDGYRSSDINPWLVHWLSPEYSTGARLMVPQPWPPPTLQNIMSDGINPQLKPWPPDPFLTLGGQYNLCGNQFVVESGGLQSKPPWWLLICILQHQEQDLLTWLLLRKTGTVIHFVFSKEGSKYMSFPSSRPHKMLKWFALSQGDLMINGLCLHQLVKDGNTLALIFLPDGNEKHIKPVTVASDVQRMFVHQPLTFSFSEIVNLDDLVMSTSPLRHAAPIFYFLGDFMVLSMQAKLEQWPLSYTPDHLVWFTISCHDGLREVEDHNSIWTPFCYNLVLVELWQRKCRSGIFPIKTEFMDPNNLTSIWKALDMILAHEKQWKNEKMILCLQPWVLYGHKQVTDQKVELRPNPWPSFERLSRGTMLSGFQLRPSPALSICPCLIIYRKASQVAWNHCQPFLESNINDEQFIYLMHSWKLPWVRIPYVHRNIPGHYLASSPITVLLGINTEAQNWEHYKLSYRWIITAEFYFTDGQERNGFSYQDNCQVWHLTETKQYTLPLPFDSRILEMCSSVGLELDFPRYNQYNLYFHLLADTRRTVLHFHQGLLPFDNISFTVLWEIAIWISPQGHNDAYAIKVNWACDWVRSSIAERSECVLFQQLPGTKQGNLFSDQGQVLPFLKFLAWLQQKSSGVLCTNIIKDQRVTIWEPGGSLHNLQATVLALDNFCVQATIQIKECDSSECVQPVFQIHVQVATSQLNTDYWHGLPLIRDGVYQVSFYIREHVSWDPGGSLHQRLGDKPCFKEGRMSGTYCVVVWSWAVTWAASNENGHGPIPAATSKRAPSTK